MHTKVWWLPLKIILSIDLHDPYLLETKSVVFASVKILTRSISLSATRLQRRNCLGFCSTALSIFQSVVGDSRVAVANEIVDPTLV